MELHRQPGCWLRSSHSLKECVIAHWSSEVRILMAESLRFLEEGSSAPSKSGAKVRPKGVADAHTVDIP